MSVPSVWKSVSILVLLLLFTQPLVLAEASQQAAPDYSHEEYDQFQSAISAAPGKREDAIIKFIKNNKSSLVQYAVGTYVQLLLEYRNQGQWQKILSGGEKLLAVQSNELSTLNITALAAFQLQQFEKAAKYWEKVYLEKPDVGIAKVLAESYVKLKNDAKILEYGEKACTQIPAKDSYQILGELTRIYASRNEWNKASEYATKSIEGFDAAQKPSQTAENDWKKYVNTQKTVAHGVLGRQAAERRRWGAAISNYQKVLGLQANSAQRAEAHYYVGMGRWRQNRVDPAMEAFARGSVQRGAPHAKPCRQYLETLYRSTHNDSLAGIEEFVERVTRRR